MSKVKLGSKKAKQALIWITELLKKHNIIYQITGGLAAKIYGSDRPLIDIDIDIPNDSIQIIFSEIKNYIIFGPEQYKDTEWDIYLTTLDYHGQLIDLSGADDGYIYDKIHKCWRKCEVNLKSAIEIEIENLNIPIISKSDLISYKVNLNREIDILDLKAIRK